VKLGVHEVMKIKNLSFKKYILVGVCGILAISSVFMTIETATSSAEVASLQKEEATLADQKMGLEDNLVKSLSMGELQTQSTEMGFVKPATLVYVAPAQAVAQLP
jgi:hypothetical protein